MISGKIHDKFFVKNAAENEPFSPINEKLKFQPDVFKHYSLQDVFFSRIRRYHFGEGRLITEDEAYKILPLIHPETMITLHIEGLTQIHASIAEFFPDVKNRFQHPPLIHCRYVPSYETGGPLWYLVYQNQFVGPYLLIEMQQWLDSQILSGNDLVRNASILEPFQSIFNKFRDMENAFGFAYQDRNAEFLQTSVSHNYQITVLQNSVSSNKDISELIELD